MGALVPFAYGDALVRVVEINAATWWVAGDVAKVLGYRETRDMTRNLDDDEAAPHIVRVRSGNGVEQDREITIISESGLYHAILKSRRPEARPFRKWVTSEVLPAIRRNGFYAMPSIEPAPRDDDAWRRMERRIDDLERLLQSQTMIESQPFAVAITYAPAVFRLERPDGALRKQRNPKCWADLPVREAIIALHRQMTLARANEEIALKFGADRAPSKSALARIWKQLDLIRGIKGSIH